MILTNEEAKQFYLNKEYYDCNLVLKRFGYSVLEENVQPLGNILCFEAPTQIGSLLFKNALVIATEIPNVNMFGGVCFQRLYCSQLGSIFSTLSQKESYLNDSVIFIEDIQATIVITNRVKESILTHIIFPLESDNKEVYHLNIPEHLETFKQQSVDSFFQLTHSLFLETQRDNF